MEGLFSIERTGGGVATMAVREAEITSDDFEVGREAAVERIHRIRPLHH